MDQLISDITHWYDLHTAVYKESIRLEQLREEEKQLIWNHRTKGREAVEYEGSPRHLLDKLLGKGDKLEKLQLEERAAKAQSENASREYARQKERVEHLQRQCDTLPSLEELKAAARTNPETERFLARRELTFCAEQLQILLQQNLEALEDYRQYLRGNRAGEILSHEQLQQIGAAHIHPAEQCAGLLRRLEPSLSLLGISFELPAYFQSPAGYVVAAAKHNQLDRINAALYQAETLQKLAARWATAKE